MPNPLNKALRLPQTARVYWRWARAELGIWRRRRRWTHQLANATDGARFHVDSPIGLSAHLVWGASILSIAESRGLVPHLVFSGQQYGGDQGRVNWLDAIVDQIRIQPDRAAEWPAVGPIREFREIPWFWDCRLDSIEEVHSRVSRHWRARPELRNRIMDFADRHWGGGFPIGVHFRGTDKWREAPPVEIAEVLACLRRVVDSVVAAGVKPIIFVASDNQGAPEFFSRQLAPVPVVWSESERSMDSRGIHGGHDADGMGRVREAMVDCLLLSRCALLVKTASALSAWAKVVRPDLPVLLMNPPHAQTNFFPDSMLAPSAFKPGQEVLLAEHALSSWAERTQSHRDDWLRAGE